MPLDRESVAARHNRILGDYLSAVRRPGDRLPRPEAAGRGPVARRSPAAVPRRTGLAARLLPPRRLLPGVIGRPLSMRLASPALRAQGPARRTPERFLVRHAEPAGMAELPSASYLHHGV